MMYILQIAAWKRGNVIVPLHLSLTTCGLQLLRNWDLSKFLDANDNTYKRCIRSQYCVYDWFHTLQQQNWWWSLGASGSVWELSDQNPRVVKSFSVLDRCTGLQVHLAALKRAGNKPGSANDKPGSANHKPGSTDDKLGSTSNHCRAVWGKPHVWERCWCAWNSWLLLIIQRFFQRMYSVGILNYAFMYLYSYPSTHSISGLPRRGAWERIEVHLRMTVEWTQRYTTMSSSSEIVDGLWGREQVIPEKHLESLIDHFWRRTWRS